MGLLSPTRRVAALIPVIVAVGLASCGGGGGSTAAGGSGGAGAKPVKIAEFASSPPTLTVPKGTTVTCTNEESTSHTASAKGSAFDSGAINPGASAEVPLEQAGTYAYFCSFHPFMKATITRRIGAAAHRTATRVSRRGPGRARVRCG
ncbi:MAG: cupredoxin domain-containing protein [Solirubrobacterales bacterium]